MRVVIFGATGMVGQGVLTACLQARDVSEIVVVGRTAPPQQDARVRFVKHDNMLDIGPVVGRIVPFDACFYCVGITSVGQTEAEYTRVTYDMTVAVVEPLARANPDATFIFVSGSGARSEETGGQMWQRVKGKAENAVRRQPFRTIAVFRPGIIIPEGDIKSKTVIYRAGYAVFTPLFRALARVFPTLAVTSTEMGEAMLNIARGGADVPILGNAEILAHAKRAIKKGA